MTGNVVSACDIEQPIYGHAQEVPAGTMNGDIVGVRDKRAPFSPVCSSEDRPWTAICKAAIRCLR